MQEQVKIRMVRTIAGSIITKVGSLAKVQDTGGGFWVVLAIDGKTIPWTIFLRDGKDFNGFLPEESRGIDPKHADKLLGHPIRVRFPKQDGLVETLTLRSRRPRSRIVEASVQSTNQIGVFDLRDMELLDVI